MFTCVSTLYKQPCDAIVEQKPILTAINLQLDDQHQQLDLQRQQLKSNANKQNSFANKTRSFNSR